MTMTPISVAGLVGTLLAMLLAVSSVRSTADLKTRSILPDAVPNRLAAAAAPTAPWDAAEFADDRIVHAVIAATLAAYPQINALCRIDLNRTFAAIGRREAWALAMFDASVKLPTGVEHGSVYQFGNFDECMVAVEPAATAAPDPIVTDGSGSRNVAVQPQYCLAAVSAVGYSVRAGANRHFQLHNETTIQWGVCLPATCTPLDTGLLLSAWTGHAEVAVDAQRCHRNGAADSYGALDVLVACIIMAMLSMVVFCSGFHAVLWLRGSSRCRTLIEQIIMSFSLFENMQKLGQASRDELGLSALNGIKALSMICIIGGHAILFMVGGPQLNTDFYAREINLLRNAFLLNSPLLVDTFLLLSGFLFAHLVLVELEKRRGRVNFGLLYVFRYVRLTPAYLAVIAVYATWLPRLGSGPLWQARMGLEQERCRQSWWLNVLYVNNYVGTADICMFQSWYLAADTQLFVLAPLVVYPLWRWRRAGLAVLGSLTVVSVLIPLATTLAYDTDPSLLPYADEVEDITTNSYFIDWYIKTHMRATSYLFGILGGFLVHYVRENDIKLGRRTVWLLWLTSCAAGLTSMLAIVAYVGHDSVAGEHGTSAWSRALYAGLHRLGWSYATTWLVLACALGHAGPLRQLLSARALVPLSRLTYCAYLTNGLVELYQAASVRTPKYMSTINMLGETTSHVLLTFIGAVALCLLFESPIHGLEKILLRRATAISSTGGASQGHHNHQEKPQRSSDSSSLGTNTESDST